MKRTERIRIYPTSRQRERLRFMLDVTRELFNALLEQRRGVYRRSGISINSKTQSVEITALRAEDPRLAAVYRECQDAVLHRLDLAFQAFFRRMRRGEAPGYPRFKSATRWKQLEFPHGDRALKLDIHQRRLRIPGVGSVPLRKGRSIPVFGRAWVVERNERWYACFECEREVHLFPETARVVGVDRGIVVLAALDSGLLLRNAAASKHRMVATAKLQRDLEASTERDARGKVLNRHNSEFVRRALRLARSKEREANVRLDNAHKVARRIVNSADVIALEKLDLRSMTRSAQGTSEQPGTGVAAKAGLNRAMLDSGFGLLRRMIVAKAEEAARTVVEVDARYSSQTCSRCGRVDSKNRRGRRFRCVWCGHCAHADVEAAREIRRRAESLLKRVPKADGESAALRSVA